LKSKKIIALKNEAHFLQSLQVKEKNSSKALSKVQYLFENVFEITLETSFFMSLFNKSTFFYSIDDLMAKKI